MTSTPRSSPSARQGILRGVYEENLRTTQEPRRASRLSQPSSGDAHRVRLLTTGMVSLGVVLLAVIAATVTTEPRAGQAIATADSSWVRLPMQGLAPIAAAAPSPSVVDLYGLHVRTIVLDAGHGGRDPGATGKRGLQEKDITLDVARRLKERLERYPGYRILLTRDGDESMLLRERVDFANQNDADLFVSLHVNWLPVDSIAPIETYYYGPDSDARAVRLAQRENRNSGYAVSEFDDLINELGLELKIQESQGAARAIQQGLIDGLRGMGRDVLDWGAKSGDFMVLLGVEAPGVLTEIGSLSNSDDEAQLTTPAYRQQLVRILEQGIAHYLGSHANESARTQYDNEEEREGV